MDFFLVFLIAVAVIVFAFYEPFMDRYVNKHHAQEYADEDPISDKLVSVSKRFTDSTGATPRIGTVTLNGVNWKAETSNLDRSIEVGDKCQVVERNGLTLIVEPLNDT